MLCLESLGKLLLVGRREHHDWGICHPRPLKKLPWDSSKTAEVTAKIELPFISIASGQDIKQKMTKRINVACAHIN